MRKSTIRTILVFACSVAFVSQAVLPLHAQQRRTAQPTHSVADRQLSDLIAQLGQLGEQLTKAKAPILIAAINLEQANVIGKILELSRPEDRANWFRQLADCLLAAASVNNEQQQAALHRLQHLKGELEQARPGSTLVAYVTLQTLEAEYMVALNVKGANLEKVQDEWCRHLDVFVQTYPDSDATPRAVHEMAVTSEALGKHENARRCCHYLVEHFPTNPLATDGRRLLNWIDLDGKVLHLALPRLMTEDARFDSIFDLESLRGKIVIVYFWNSSTSNWHETFEALQKAGARYHGQAVEVVCVNMDETPKSVREELKGVTVPGIQVFQRNGVDGYTGQRLGLPEMPAILVLGRDGRVLERVAGLGQLEVNVTKHLRKESPVIQVSNPAK